MQFTIGAYLPEIIFRANYSTPEEIKQLTENTCQYFVLFTDDLLPDSQYMKTATNAYFVNSSKFDLVSYVEGVEYHLLSNTDLDYQKQQVQEFIQRFDESFCTHPLVNAENIHFFGNLPILISKQYKELLPGLNETKIGLTTTELLKKNNLDAERDYLMIKKDGKIETIVVNSTEQNYLKEIIEKYLPGYQQRHFATKKEEYDKISKRETRIAEGKPKPEPRITSKRQHKMKQDSYKKYTEAEKDKFRETIGAAKQ
ncbi:Hypothetical_protein [Hexamita inflata]|uniref:Hypothetical_protein n=1 Tax=Hexamita inflata TaxID=28002 RepID=A0AA86UUQ7_9EUKA|nr:Hypothetical protein HINF_LOCUS60165 [Hexamita inflata]